MKPGNLAALFLFILPVIFIYCGIQTECSQIQWKHYHCGYSPRIHKMAVRDRYCIHLQSPVVSGLLSFCTVVPIKTDCYPNARFCPFISGCTGSTPGQGTKIPHATQWRVCVCVCVCVSPGGGNGNPLWWSCLERESVCVCVCVCVSPGGGNGNPLWWSCLENPIDRGAGLQSMGVSESDTTEVT